jgi:hypothetical protein
MLEIDYIMSFLQLILSIKFEDGVGVTIENPKKLTMSAEEEIIMRTPKSVKIDAQSQLAIVKTNSGSGLAVEEDFLC